jgi:hypothetical protein
MRKARRNRENAQPRGRPLRRQRSFFFGRHGGARRPAVFQNLPMMALFPTETAFGKLHKLFPKNFLNFVQFTD